MWEGGHLGVGDEDEDGGVLGEVLLEPHARLHVEVIRRLVEQQQRRLRPAQRLSGPRCGTVTPSPPPSRALSLHPPRHK